MNRWGSILGLAALAGIGTYWVVRHATAPVPPAISMGMVDPAAASLIQDSTAAVRKSPRDPAAWGRLGMVLLAHGFESQAAVCFDHAEHFDPSSARWRYLDAIALRNEHHDLFVRKLQEAADLSGEAEDVPHLRFAETLLEDGNLDAAERQIRPLIEREPDNARALLDLARLEIQRGNLREGRETLHRVLVAAPGSLSAHALLANVDVRLGETAEASREMKRAMRSSSDPEWSDPWVDEVNQLRTGTQATLDRADALLTDGRITEAAPMLERSVRDHPDSERAWLLEGRALRMEDRIVDSESALRHAIALEPASVQANLQLGLTLMRLQKPAEAADCFRRSIQLQPEIADGHFNLAICLERTGDEARAAEEFAATVRCNPDLVEGYLALARALFLVGRKPEAIQTLKQAHDLDPSDLRTSHMLIEIATPATGPVQ